MNIMTNLMGKQQVCPSCCNWICKNHTQKKDLIKSINETETNNQIQILFLAFIQRKLTKNLDLSNNRHIRPYIILTSPLPEK